jgi:hypothetical protein
MRFEDESVQYLNDLCTIKTFISGNIVGVNEIREVSEANVMVEINNNIVERSILIYKLNYEIKWKYLYLIKNKNNDESFLSPMDWTYPEFQKRIIAQINLVLEYPQFEIWFRINQLPIVNKNGMLYCYCNEILPEHQYLIDQLYGNITVENKQL